MTNQPVWTCHAIRNQFSHVIHDMPHRQPRLRGTIEQSGLGSSMNVWHEYILLLKKKMIVPSEPLVTE